MGRIGLDLPAQPTDVYIQRSGSAHPLFAPDSIQQVVARNHGAVCVQQGHQQIVLARGESDRLAAAGDGVSPIMITGNDFAGAWAIDANGASVLPTVPPDEMQREMSFRSGVNIMMYMLTGNYKADQVHVPALLERLGQ